MLTALFKGEKIISINPCWVDIRDEINEIAVCPQCKQPIICKFGDVNIHHFAHSNKANCSGSNDTLEHMSGKALLYEYLKNYYKDEAIIDIEHNMEDDIIADFLIEHNGRKLVIEFFSGHLKNNKLKEKVSYYESNSIQVIWIISMNRLEFIKENFWKIKKVDIMFADDTVLDKFYDEGWYEKYPIYQNDFFFNRMKPKENRTLGSLNFLDITENKFFIARAIKQANHIHVFEVGKLLSGALCELKVSSKKPFVYFEEEIEWYKKCDEIDKSLSTNKEIHSIPIHSDSNKNSLPTIYKTDSPSKYSGLYRCVKCKCSFPASEMSDKRFEDLREGLCKNCG